MARAPGNYPGRMSLLLVAVALLAGQILTPDKTWASSDTASTSTNPNCSRDIATTSPGQSTQSAPVAAGGKPASLESTGPATPINISGGEGVASTDIVLTASPSLPANVTPDQITIDVPARFRRNGTTLSTEYLPDPTFSSPRIIENRKVISFRLCFDTKDVSAGSYVGQIVISAPGIQPATVAVTLNEKDTVLFVLGGLAALAVAFLLLLFQAMQSKWQAQAATKKNLRKAVSEPLHDLFGFWAPTVFALAAATVAIWQVYDADPAWGADWGASAIALVGTALAAAGLGTLLSSFKKT